MCKLLKLTQAGELVILVANGSSAGGDAGDDATVA